MRRRWNSSNRSWRHSARVRSERTGSRRPCLGRWWNKVGAAFRYFIENARLVQVWREARQSEGHWACLEKTWNFQSKCGNGIELVASIEGGGNDDMDRAKSAFRTSLGCWPSACSSKRPSPVGANVLLWLSHLCDRRRNNVCVKGHAKTGQVRVAPSFR